MDAATLRRHPILVVDDEADILRAFRFAYEDAFDIVTAPGGDAALARLAEIDPAVIVADQRMPGMTGTEFLARSTALRPDAVRVVLTGYTDVQSLVEAVNAAHIWRYVAKPWDTEEMRHALERAVEVFVLRRDNARLMEELRAANARLATENAFLRHVAAPPAEIVGESAAVRKVLELVAKVAPSRTTVLVEGETGTGKELVARAIHAASPRRDALFVAVNCAALSEGLLESELFGHRKGAFTGATADRKGLFEVADGGTLFLDEISETTLALQAKLLRVLQESEVRPVGENLSRKVDVRVVAATNRALQEEVAAGRFREDLYYRLRVFPVPLPPLRERLEDVGPLARHLVRRIAAAMGKVVGEPTPETLALLARHRWPGNVRELANELERAILMADHGAPVTDDLLSDHLQADAGAAPGMLQRRTDEFERQQILACLERHGGVKARVAEELGLSYRGLMKKLRRLGL